MKLIDITKELFSTPPYPDDPIASHRLIRDMKKGYTYNMSEITLGAHNATHIDAPLHFIDGGDDVSDIDLDKCFGSCRVAEQRFISLSDAESLCKNTKRLLLKGKVDISPPAASLLAKHLDLIGTEQLTIGDAMVHKIFLRAGVVILESLDLSEAPVGSYLLSALPLKMKGVEGSPCRAVLIGE